MYLNLVDGSGKKTEAFFNISEVTIKEDLLEPGQERVILSVDGIYRGILEFKLDEMDTLVNSIKSHLHPVKDSRVVGET